VRDIVKSLASAAPHIFSLRIRKVGLTRFAQEESEKGGREKWKRMSERKAATEGVAKESRTCHFGCTRPFAHVRKRRETQIP
jgi:hypothetical protein